VTGFRVLTLDVRVAERPQIIVGDSQDEERPRLMGQAHKVMRPGGYGASVGDAGLGAVSAAW
jgi:hypothetical protein